MTEQEKKHQKVKKKIDDLNEVVNCRNVKFTDKEKDFILNMKTRIFVTEAQEKWVNSLWDRI